MIPATLSSESIATHQQWLIDRGLSPLTAKAYSADLRVFLTHHQKTQIPPEELEPLARQWLNTTSHTRESSPKTTQRRATSVKSWARWAGVRHGLDDFKLPIAARAIPHPLPEGIEGVEACIGTTDDPVHQALLALCGLCGLRIAEALLVTPQNIHLRGQMLHVHGKGNKDRKVPISDKAFNYLATRLIYLLALPEGNSRPLVPLSDSGARAVISRLGRRAGLERHISSHDLRATFATAVYQKTKDIRVVQELLGHANVNTTQLYLGLTVETMREAVNL